MLGRPHMVRKEIYDVELPNSTNDDGVFDLYGFNQRIMIELAELLGEAMDTVSTHVHGYHCAELTVDSATASDIPFAANFWQWTIS